MSTSIRPEQNDKIKEEIWLDNESIKNAVCSILSIEHQELDLILPVKSDEFARVREVFNQILNNGISKKWRRALCFKLDRIHLNQPNFSQATVQFTQNFNADFTKPLAFKNFQTRLEILKVFEANITNSVNPLLIINNDLSNSIENTLYEFSSIIEHLFHEVFLVVEQMVLDKKKMEYLGHYSVSLNCEEIKFISHYVSQYLLDEFKKRAVDHKNPDDIWTRLIINSTLNRSIIEIDMLEALNAEVISEHIQNLLNTFGSQELNSLNFDLEKSQFIDYLSCTVKPLKNFSVDKDEIFIQVEEFYKKNNETRVKPKSKDTFAVIHNSTQCKNLMILIFVWIAFSKPKLNTKISGDTNTKEKIIFNGKKGTSINIFYYLRRMYNSMYYAMNIESKTFHFQYDRLKEYQDAISAKHLAVRNIYVEMKTFPMSSFEQWIKK